MMFAPLSFPFGTLYQLAKDKGIQSKQTAKFRKI